jgi:hypothetical protein
VGHRRRSARCPWHAQDASQKPRESPTEATESGSAETLQQEQAPGAETPSTEITPGATQSQTDHQMTGDQMQGKEVHGKVKSWDSAQGVLTLEDGTELKVPAGTDTQADGLSEGATIRAMYEEKGGEKVVSDLEVMQ